MGMANCAFVGEIQDAPDASIGFDHVTLRPNRLSSYILISKEFLAQDALSAEQLIRNELVNAINSKLEATILGTEKGTATKPAGLFYDVSTLDVSSFVDITTLEASVEESNIYGEMKYIVSPKAKAALRNMPRSADHSRLVMENNEIDGTPVLSTTNIAQNNLAYGDWSSVAVAQFGSLELLIDPYTYSRSSQIQIVVNSFWDWKLLRPGALVYGTTDVSTGD